MIYDDLPGILRAMFTRREYEFMSDLEKQNIIEIMTQPDEDAEDDVE